MDYCDCNPDFGIADPVTEITVKPSTKQTVEILVSEQCVIIWEVRVVGWEVAYGAEFIPDAEDEYTVVVQKATKMAPTDDPVMCNSSKIKQLRDDLKDMAFEMNSLMEELKVVRKESLIEKFVAGLSMDILQFHTVVPLGDPLLHGLHGHL